MSLNKLKNKAGFSLVEIMIASGLMALVASGLVSVVTAMNKEQNNQFRTAALRELKTRFQFLITDQNAWAMTLQKNGTAGLSMECLVKKTACTAGGIYDLKLYDPAGVLAFDPLPFATASPSYAPAAGFADKGSPCTTFNGNAGAGVDSCPISYKVVWEPICPSSGVCINPLVRVTVRLVFNPGPTSSNLVLSTGAVPPTASWTDDSVASNTGKYDVVIKRSATTLSKSFFITVNNGGAATPSGSCPVGSYVARGSVGPGWTRNANDDPFSLVSVSGADITIKAGTYSCKTASLGYAVDTFFTKLVQTTGPGSPADLPGSATSSNAPYIGLLQSVATANPVISMTQDSTFQLQQKCTTLNPDPVGETYALGLPASPYTALTTFASLLCTQTN